MKCISCGSDMKGKNVCPICGSIAGSSNKSKNVYTGIDANATPVHTRSKKVAFILACMGGNDLYLYYWSRFFWKMVVLFVTCGFGYLIWQIADIIGIATGRINTDALGNPME